MFLGRVSRKLALQSCEGRGRSFPVDVLFLLFFFGRARPSSEAIYIIDVATAIRFRELRKLSATPHNNIVVL
jgi:hypothetical protein